jgi:hypothetical protein
VSQTAFWKPQPREPWSDWRMFCMLVPILVSAFGFFVTGVFAFAFSDIAVIPGPSQSWLVILGSALIIFGAELNTPFTTVEVFRKILRGEANGWDTSALAVSLVGTVVNLLVTFASRLSLHPAWKGVVLNWGPLLSGFAVACDYYGALVELGFLFGSYETRMESWLVEKRQWTESDGRRTADDGRQSTPHGIRNTEYAPRNTEPEWRPARIDDFQRVLGRLNGQRATLTAGQLQRELAQDQLLLPSSRTVNRWLKMARN